MTPDDLKPIDELLTRWREDWKDWDKFKAEFLNDERTVEYICADELEAALHRVRDALAAKMSEPPHCVNCSCLYEAAKEKQ